MTLAQQHVLGGFSDQIKSQMLLLDPSCRYLLLVCDGPIIFGKHFLSDLLLRWCCGRGIEFIYYYCRIPLMQIKM